MRTVVADIRGEVVQLGELLCVCAIEELLSHGIRSDHFAADMIVESISDRRD